MYPLVLIMFSFLHGVSTISPCDRPAREGHHYTFTHIVDTPYGSLDWLIDIKNPNIGDVSVATCYRDATIHCPEDRQRDPSKYTSTISRLDGGRYRVTLTITSVTRPRDETTWILKDSRKIFLQCDLKVYSFDSKPQCQPPHVTNRGTPSHPDMSVSWTCAISRIYPKFLCQFYYKDDKGNYISTDPDTDPDTSITYSIPKLTSGSPGYYDNNECTLTLPVPSLTPGMYTFNVTVYPDIEGTSPSLGTSLESSGVDMAFPAPVCGPPTLTDDNTRVVVTCGNQGSLYHEALCNIVWMKVDTRKVFSYVVAASSTCGGNPPSCNNTCTMTMDIIKRFDGVGSYRFKAGMKPVVSQGTPVYTYSDYTTPITFALPTSTIKDCPSGSGVKDGYIKTGTTATCQCHLTDVGNPPGHPQWVDSKGVPVGQDQGNGINILSLTYNHQDPSLSPPYTCRSSSYLGHETIDEDTRFTPKFAYGPGTIVMSMNPDTTGQSNPSFILCEPSATFTLYCDVPVATVNPKPSVTVEGKDTNQITPQPSPGKTVGDVYRYDYNVNPKTGGILTLKCVASNTVFGDMKTQVEGTITINAPPPSPPIMTVDQGLSIHNDVVTVTHGQRIAVRCRVEGGTPPVSSVTITCDDGVRTVDGIESTHTLDVDKDMNQMSCVCKASHETGCYTKTTRLTLNVQYATTLIEYKANSKMDSLEVNDGDRVVFHCKAEGNPRPYLSIKGHRSRESLILQEKTGEITKLMRCVDTANYTCVAGSNVGDSVAKSIAVFVKCGPILAELNKNKKEFTHTNDNATDLVVKVYIIGYPPPTEYTLTKPSNQAGRTIRDVSVEEVDIHLYKVDYISVGPGLGTVVLRMFDLEDEDSGKYILVMKNGIGDGLDYSFTVTVVSGNPCKPTSTNDESNTVAVAAGVNVVCGLILSALMFVLGVYVEKRRVCKKKTPTQVVILQPSPEYEDNTCPLAEAYVGVEDVKIKEVKRKKSPQQDDDYVNPVPVMAVPQQDDTYYETPDAMSNEYVELDSIHPGLSAQYENVNIRPPTSTFKCPDS